MSNIFTTKTVTVTWPAGDPGADFATAELRAIAHPYGEQWGTAQIRFPRARAQSSAVLSGKAIRIAYDGATVFAGHVGEMPQLIGPAQDDCTVTALDYRWYLSKRKIGQYGTGSIATTGGFPFVGFRVHFNADGHANRSKTKTAGAYNFYSAPDADAWTAKDILEFLLTYYGAGVTFDPASLPAGWDDDELDFFPYGDSLTTALSRLCARLGQAWSIRYDGANVLFCAIANTSATTQTVTIAGASDGAKAQDANDWTARSATVTRRITDSVDRVEVHSARARFDVTLTTTTGDPNAVKALTFFDASKVVAGFGGGFVMDPTGFTPTILADMGLLEKSQPLRWYRELNTKLTDDRSNYADADAVVVIAGVSDSVYAEHCLWIQPQGLSTVKRLRSGFRIIPQSSMVLLENELTFADGTTFAVESNDATAWGDFWITVNLEWSENAIRYTPFPPAAGWLADENHKMTEIAVRSDLVPRERYKVTLPDITSTDPDAVVHFGTPVETYVTITDQMDLLHARLLAARKTEITVEAELLDIPVITPGALLAIGPADFGLTGREVITHYQAEFGEKNAVTLFATTNLARIAAGDL